MRPPPTSCRRWGRGPATNNTSLYIGKSCEYFASLRRVHCCPSLIGAHRSLLPTAAGGHQRRHLHHQQHRHHWRHLCHAARQPARGAFEGLSRVEKVALSVLRSFHPTALSRPAPRCHRGSRPHAAPAALVVAVDACLLREHQLQVDIVAVARCSARLLFVSCDAPFVAFRFLFRRWPSWRWGVCSACRALQRMG